MVSPAGGNQFAAEGRGGGGFLQSVLGWTPGYSKTAVVVSAPAVSAVVVSTAVSAVVEAVSSSSPHAAATIDNDASSAIAVLDVLTGLPLQRCYWLVRL